MESSSKEEPEMKNMAWRNIVCEEGSRKELIHYLVEAWGDVDELKNTILLLNKSMNKENK